MLMAQRPSDVAEPEMSILESVLARLLRTITHIFVLPATLETRKKSNQKQVYGSQIPKI